jgi:hypothetical protein
MARQIPGSFPGLSSGSTGGFWRTPRGVLRQRSCKAAACVASAVVLVDCFAPAQGATITSTWVGTTNAWTTASNWNPSTSSPANGGGNVYLVNISTVVSPKVEPVLNASVQINSLTLNGGASLGIQGAGVSGNSLQLENASNTNNGTITVNTGGTAANLIFASGGTLGGAGTVDLNAATTGAVLSCSVGGVTSTNTIDGEGEIIGTLTNDGTVDASGASAMLLGSAGAGGLSVTNNSVIESSGSGGMQLGTSNFSANITQGASGKIVVGSNASAAIVLDNAQITGGTCTLGLGDSGGMSVTSGTLNGITLDVNVSVAGSLSLAGTITNNDLITVTGTMSPGGGGITALSGSGSVTMSGGVITGGGITSDQVIAGHGTIDANLTNNLTVEAESGTLTLQSATEFNNSLLASNGGLLKIDTSVTQGSNGVIMAINGSTVQIGGLITGGSVTTINSAKEGVIIAEPGGSLSGVTNKGTLTIPAGVTLGISGSVINTGTITGGGGIGGAIDNLGTIDSTGTMVISGAVSGNGTLSTPTGGTIQLAAGGGRSTAGAVHLQILGASGNGTLDLTNNSLLINYGSGADPIASVQAWLASGFNGGAWNGVGINSSTAAANSASYGIGYADSADPGNPAGLSSGTLLIQYTLLGDADLNKVVNGIDFGILAANFNKSVTAWDQGDFDYNNIVNGIDFGFLAANFNKGASGAADVAAMDAFAAANGLLADVPEPGSLGLLALALVGAAGVVPRRSRGKWTKGADNRSRFWDVGGSAWVAA